MLLSGTHGHAHTHCIYIYAYLYVCMYVFLNAHEQTHVCLILMRRSRVYLGLGSRGADVAFWNIRHAFQVLLGLLLSYAGLKISPLPRSSLSLCQADLRTSPPAKLTPSPDQDQENPPLAQEILVILPEA